MRARHVGLIAGATGLLVAALLVARGGRASQGRKPQRALAPVAGATRDPELVSAAQPRAGASSLSPAREREVKRLIASLRNLPRTPDSEPPPAVSASEPIRPEHEDFSAANGRYLMEVLGPRVRECWHRVSGDGEIELRHTFVIQGGVATVASIEDGADAVSKVESELTPEQDAVALDCVRRAAEGTSFVYTPMTLEDHAPTLTIYQRWPTRVQIARQLAGPATGG